MFLAIHEHQAPPDDGKYEPLIPGRLGEGVAVGLQDLPVGLGADDEDGVAVKDGEVADEVGARPRSDPCRVGLDGRARGELAEGLAEEEVVILEGKGAALVSDCFRLWGRGGEEDGDAGKGGIAEWGISYLWAWKMAKRAPEIGVDEEAVGLDEGILHREENEEDRRWLH